MATKTEQRLCIKFCVKLGDNATETHKKLQKAWGDVALKKTAVFEWHKRFSRGRESVEDDDRSGAPVEIRTDENVNKIRDLINEDRRLTIRELVQHTGLSFGTIQKILTSDLGMRRISAKFVPRLLTIEQKQHRLDTCHQLQQAVTEDPNYLNSIITTDESWVYGYDPETKLQSSQWKSPSSPRPKKARMSKSSVKTMLIVFFDINGIVHSEYIPTGTSITQYVYLDILRRLKESVRRKRPDLARTGGWKLHQDNAPAHTAIRVREYLAKHGIPLVPHPPYSPDLAPCDFWLFPKIKYHLKGQRFDTIEDIQRNTTSALRSLTKQDYAGCFTKWQDRWTKCVAAEGEYFEGD